MRWPWPCAMVAAPCRRRAAKPKPSPVRVQVLTQTQNAVASSKRIRVRVSSTRRGFVRLGGRVVTTPGGKRRIVRLTQRRTLKVSRGTRRTLLLKLLARGRKEIGAAKKGCRGSRVQVFALYDARRRARDVGKGKTVRYDAQGKSLRRDLRRCLPGAQPGGAGGGYRVGVADRSINPGADGTLRRPAGVPGRLRLRLGADPDRAAPPTASWARASACAPSRVSDGRRSMAVADIETQGWFAATKDGPYGLVDMRKRVQAATGGALTAGATVIQSDHSHSGPDTMGVWGGVPAAYRQMIADRTVEAIVEAFRTMQPGTLYYGTAPGRDLLSNQFDYDAANQAVDSDVRVLQARTAAGRPFATLLNFSAHPTVLGSGNRKVSGDWVSSAGPALARRFGGEAMTMVGTLGRTQPADRGCAAAPLPPAGPDARPVLDRRVRRARGRARRGRRRRRPSRWAATPLVEARSFLVQDVATNAPILGLNVAGRARGRRAQPRRSRRPG